MSRLDQLGCTVAQALLTVSLALMGCRERAQSASAMGSAPRAGAAAGGTSVAVSEPPPSVIAAVPAGDGPGVVAPQPAPAPTVVWRFRAAAPVSGSPAIAEDGSVYVTSVEGYVHALARDGSFRWSYNLGSAPVGGPTVDREGRIYVTTASRVYAFRPEGRLHWQYRAPTRITTPALWAAPGVLYFTGRDRRLYALASWGAVLWKRWLGHSVSAPPIVLADGGVALGTAGAELCFFRRSGGVQRISLPGVPTRHIVAGEQCFAVTADAEVLALGARAPARVSWRAQARHVGSSADGNWLVAERGRELAWLAPASGERLAVRELPGDPSSAIAVSNRGIAMVPLVSGSIVLLHPGGRHVAEVQVGAAPLWQPVWSERMQRLTVAAGNGAVAALDLRSWPSPDEERESGARPRDTHDADAKASGLRLGTSPDDTGKNPSGSGA